MTRSTVPTALRHPVRLRPLGSATVRPPSAGAESVVLRPDAATLARLHAVLEVQRDFRLEQLAHLDRQRGRVSLSGAHREVYVSLGVGARMALHEAQSALWRMDEGRYGSCISCGDAIELAVLETLPQTARCSTCQRAAAIVDHE